MSKQIINFNINERQPWFSKLWLFFYKIKEMEIFKLLYVKFLVVLGVCFFVFRDRSRDCDFQNKNK